MAQNFLLPELEVVATPGPSATASTNAFQREPFLQRAVVVINGQEYHEWESVAVRHAIAENPAFSFRFTCSEQGPFAQSWSALRIRPGDWCEVYLDGLYAMNARVLTRQVSYNARQHAVEIQGATHAVVLSRGVAQTQTGEFKNVTIKELASALARPYGVNVKELNQVSSHKFERVSIEKGERVWDVIEQWARQVSVHLTSNIEGDLVLYGKGGAEGGDVLEEGKNILEGREVIHSIAGASGYATEAQGPGNDQVWGAIPTSHRVSKDGATGGFNESFLPRVVLSEAPGFSIEQLKGRGNIEDMTDHGVKIWVVCTILGWQKPSGGLWVRGQNVFVKSPMLIMDRTLTLKAVTFTQGPDGTKSILELVNPAALGNFAQE